MGTRTNKRIIELTMWQKYLGSKKMLKVYLLLLLGFIGIVMVIYERYLTPYATAHDAATMFGNSELIEATKAALFGSVGEVKREAPWSLYIANYMYMIYVGSGVVFLVSLAEIFNVRSVMKVAAGFLSVGFAMIVAGLFTIMMDLDLLKLHHLILSAQFTSGMWLMLPLYMIYLPLILLEIYLILREDAKWIKPVAFTLLLVGLLVEFVEFYIQAKLFDMNSARHLWTTYPVLTLYFMVSSFVSSAAVMMLYTYLHYSKENKAVCNALMQPLQRFTLYAVLALGVYEATSYLFIDKEWANIILFGAFRYYFYLYLALSIAIPFLLLIKDFNIHANRIWAAVSIIVGTYLGKIIFVYGGNAYPMSDRFGTGFEKYGEYDQAKEIIFFMPGLSEILIVLGSFGILLAIYLMFETFFAVSVPHPLHHKKSP